MYMSHSAIGDAYLVLLKSQKHPQVKMNSGLFTYLLVTLGELLNLSMLLFYCV